MVTQGLRDAILLIFRMYRTISVILTSIVVTSMVKYIERAEANTFKRIHDVSLVHRFSKFAL